MSHYHFEIKSGKHGTSAEFVSYITRKGSHAERDDLVAVQHGNMPEWAEYDPDLVWKASDKYERKNGCVYRNITFSLPTVLTVEQNVELAREVVVALAGAKPFQFAVHMPRSSLEGESHPHTHAMISDRVPDGIERPPEQTFRRYNPTHPERGGRRKDSGGMNRMQLRDNVLAMRKVVADTTNAALERHGHTVRVDHRTLREQGISRKPEQYIGPARIRLMSDAEKEQYIRLHRGERQRDAERTRE